MVHVLKATGVRELFSEDKILHSIHRAGIPKSLQIKVLEHIKSILYDNIPSKEIYSHINEYLETTPEPFSTSRYRLKQAIMDLGPTGYPFEDYVGKILQQQGFTTLTRQIVQGTCITHEIDVIAEKHTVLPTRIMIEAKFHNNVGMRTNVHVPMYTKSRFDDTKLKNNFTEVWIVTNTKATIDAIAFAACTGMKIITWSYPEGNSLRDLVEKFHLFPLTVLHSLPSFCKQQLLSKGVVLCKDICETPELLNVLPLTKSEIATVLAEVGFVCHLNGSFH